MFRLSVSRLSTHSNSAVYGGIAIAACEKEIFSTIANGIAKNSSIHRYGTEITSPARARQALAQRLQRAAHEVSTTPDIVVPTTPRPCRSR